MKITVNWLKDYLTYDAPLEALTDKLTAIGLEVDGVENQGAALAPFTVAEIIEAEQHPDADRLRICKVQSDAGELQIVCGAPNARAGIKVALAKVGAVIPNGDFVIKKSKIRGVESVGMLCSANELGLGADSDGIMELPESASIGAPVAEILGINDAVIDIAITPNRGDCLGVYGIARDLAAADFGTLKPIRDSITDYAALMQPSGNASDMSITLQSEHCPCFMGRIIRGVKNGTSPEWLQSRLKAIGLRPISTLVDITNYMTMTFARPLHVYDLAKIHGGITVRDAQAGESFDALNDKSYTLTGGECVIADDDAALGLGGIVGGVPSSVSEETTDILLECAWFAPIHIAENGRKHSIDSDARYRFERTVDAGFMQEGEAIATRMILDLCGGEAADVTVAGTPPIQTPTIAYTPDYSNARLGVSIDAATQQTMLEKLGFGWSEHGDHYDVTAPSWRADVRIQADISEEIARMYGYDALPVTAMPAAEHNGNKARPRTTTLRHLLINRGAHEVQHFAFISEAHAQLFAQGRDGIALQNPISSDLSYMRPSLLPAMLMAAARNQARGRENIALFEIGRVFDGTAATAQPITTATLRAGASASKDWIGSGHSVDMYDAKADLEAQIEACGLDPAKCQVSNATPDYYHPGRSGALTLGPKKVLGYFGEIHPAILKAFDCSGRIMACELMLENLPPAKPKKPIALTASDFQTSVRDFAFMVDVDTPAGDILRAVSSADKTLVKDVSLFDVYQGEHMESGKKSLALSVTLQSADKTLSEEEITHVSDAIIAAAAKQGAVLRG